VILPNLAAGCSMADMASIDDVEDCWEQLADIYGRWMPPTPTVSSR
jgi:quinolinate synthase